MTANLRTYRLTVTSHEGQPLFTVLVTRERTQSVEPATTSVPAVTAPVRSNGQAHGREGEPRMTEPQKRYLFRLLAQQGIDAKAAEGHLKEVLQVATLREVSKMAASQLIEQMVANQKEASDERA